MGYGRKGFIDLARGRSRARCHRRGEAVLYIVAEGACPVAGVVSAIVIGEAGDRLADRLQRAHLIESVQGREQVLV